MLSLMKSLHHLRVRLKLLLIIASALVGVVALVSMSLWFSRQDLQREKELKTRHLVEAACTLVEFYQSRAASGELSEPEAQKRAMTALQAMHYGGSEYFWITDMHPRIVMHHGDPYGQDVSGLRDVTGKLFLVECVEKVRQRGEGFVYYLWPKPGFTEPVQKLSFFKGFAPWGWVIGTGVYLDDVQVVFRENAVHYTAAGAAVFLLITAMSLVLASSIARTEESLRSSQEKFHKAFHTSPIGYTICRKSDGVLLETNDAFLKATGYTRQEVLGTTVPYHGLTLEGPERGPLPPLAPGERLCDVEAWRGGKAGEWLNVLLSVEQMALDRVDCLILIERDISEQKAKERQLLRGKAELTVKHEQLRTLFKTMETVKLDWERTLDCIDDQVVVLDQQGRVKRCNRPARRFLGLPRAELLGADWNSVARGAGIPLLGPQCRSAEFFHQESDRWFSCTFYPGSAEPDLGSGAVITLHDTTDSKRAAVELGRAYAELKATQSQMLQQEKMASIGQLAAGVAHEINNPTGFVMSNLATLGKYTERLARFIAAQGEALDAGGEGGEAGRLAELRRELKIDRVLDDLPALVAESLEGTERVKTIVQNLKSFSHSDQAQSQLTDLRDCIESTINIVWNELKYKVDLSRDYADIPAIVCYPQQLCQVIMNLLVNAAHAIEGRGEIRVRTWQQEGAVLFSVSDTGCGIKLEHRARIFEPFFTTKEVGKGTGLGLSISFNIVKNHGGEIEVASEPGCGTVFTVKLPTTLPHRAG